MRCKNCGWPNQPGETNCVKCHAPLEAGGMGTVIDDYPQPGGDQNLKKTVLEVNPYSITEDKPVAQESYTENDCLQCGFPLRPGAVKCPKCGSLVTNSGQNARRPTVVDTPDNSDTKNVFPKDTKSARRTVNIYIDGFEEEHEYYLLPVKRSNEKKEPEKIMIEGDEIQLNRDNADPGNMTIASKLQAVITKEDDKWYITDKSETKTTFVRASDKLALEDGSLILLGNRLFEFHIQ